MAFTVQAPQELFPNREYLFCSALETDNRKIWKFLYDDRIPSDKAAEALNKLISGRKLCVTFPNDPAELSKEIEQKKYLIINGYALCLLNSMNILEAADPSYIDTYFSNVLMEEPVQCTHGVHCFEKRYAEIWKRTMGDICPGGDHDLGDLELNHPLKTEIQKFKRKQETLNEFLDNQIIKELSHLQQQAFIEKQAEEVGVKVMGEMAKLALKGGAKVASKQITNELAKLIVKQSGKAITEEALTQVGRRIGSIAFKGISGVSLLIGVGLCVYRVRSAKCSSDYLKATLELLSGVAGCIPGAGTVVSVSIDVGLVGHDMRAFQMRAIQQARGVEENNDGLDDKDKANRKLNLAYKALSISQSNPTKEQVETHWKHKIASLHPDRPKDVGDSRGDYTVFVQFLNEAKDIIFEQRGWK